MTRSLRFGSAEVRPAERQLLVDGQPVFIGARAFDVLHLLITHRERVVGKNELLEAVWPGLVVEENNLQVQISALRKILGAGAITTVAGQGYQFTAMLDSERDTLPGAGGPLSAPKTQLPAGQRAALGAPAEPAAPVPRLAVAGRGTRLALGVAIGLAIGIGAWAVLRTKPDAATVASMGTNAQTAPAHSVAVLPFVNMSGDPTQDYFSDSLSEELLNSLSSIPDLHVAARTSSFSFKGKNTTVAVIGHELNVGAVLEGSVRKDGKHVRITVQLVDVATGFELWSHAYDRDLGNILTLQTEIATAVIKALQATLLPNAAAALELGSTQNPQAFDAYLQAESLEGREDKETVLTQIAAYDEAIRQDPSFAKAYVGKAMALSFIGGNIATSSSVHEYYAQARGMAEKALALAPELGQAHSALAQILVFGFFDFTHSLKETERALALSPGDTFVLQRSVSPLTFVGRTESAVTNARRAVALDPINATSHETLGFALYFARQYRKAIEAYNRALSLNPKLTRVTALRGLSYKRLGEIDGALQSCSTPPINTYNHVCLAIAYHQQNRASEARAEVAKIRQYLGDAGAYQYAEIYAQWGDVSSALQWLETADRLRDSGLVLLKTDELLDPLRKEPRFQKIERELRFPN
jgi:TolB-like protein/DNA-binding winged helix-turn-helix (wHTH) protein